MSADNKYKSPISKVVSFLERSRDNWKKKYTDLMQRVRRLENQVRAVEDSRAKWRQEAERATLDLEEFKKSLADHACIGTTDG